MGNDNVIGAFSEDQAARISGLSKYQLIQWSREGLICASFAAKQRGIPYGRLYSFRDLVSLQILDDLRNQKKVPLSHLREVARKLSHLGDARWIATTLYVLGKRVVFENPNTKKREDVVSGQRVFDIPLRIVARNTRERISELNDRSQEVGKTSQRRFVSGNRKVFAGTRVPFSGVIDFLRAGHGAEMILREFPDLSLADISLAQSAMESQAA